MLQHLVTLLQTNFSAHRAKQTTLEASDAETREREVNFRLFPYFEEEGWTFSHFFSTGWAHPENTHLLRNGKYHHTADLLFDWFGFNQTWKSLSNSTSAKSNWILSSQTVGQPHSDTSPYEVCECSLFPLMVSADGDVFFVH